MNRAGGRVRRQIMFETLAAISIAAGFVFVVALVAGPGRGAPAVNSPFANAPMPDRPRGVQEMDLAPFRFRDPEPEPFATRTDPVRASEGRRDPALAA
jgi:hypothetical protein